MKHQIVTPSVGESVTEVSILKWHKPDGAAVKAGEVLLEIESDKATVELVAESAGALTIGKPAGERIPIGAVIGFIDDAVAGKAAAASATAATPPRPSAPAPTMSASALGSGPTPGPAARKMAAEMGANLSAMTGTGKDGRVTKGDLMQKDSTPAPAPRSAPTASKIPDRPGDRRVAMSMLRQKIAERLVHAQHTAAILTTFNEADMTGIMEVRNKYKDKFKAKHGVSLGFMSFFTRACVEALKTLPDVNASVDGHEVIYHDYSDVGIAVGTDRGLVVPVLRNAEKMGFVDIEKKIAEFGAKAKEGKLSIADMTGGTFTISNGGVYGSLLSTPILNPPQSAILGMHKTQDRPVAINGKVEVRPMMYLALSYDHRIIDGKGAVTFLVTVKDLLENPAKLGLEFTNGL